MTELSERYNTHYAPMTATHACGAALFTGYFRDAETGDDYAVNRYHQPGMGRFLTPDPYRGSASPSNPKTWNRYAYTNGDPINFIDRKGLDGGFVAVCDPNDPTCDDGDDDSGDDDSGDGGSGWNYNYPCAENGYAEVPGEGCVAAAAASTTEASSTVVTSVDITGDCWQLHSSNLSLLGAPSRNQTFTAFDGTQNLAGQNIVITESVSTSVGGALATGVIGSPNSSGTGGVFNDQKGLSSTQSGTVTLYQSFTVSINGGTPYAIPIVLANGTTVQYLTYTMSSTFSHWWNFTPNNNVVEYGQGKNQIPLCK